MTEVERALSQISEIHKHLARTEVYRGLRSVPAAAAGLLALLAAGLQPVVLGIQDPFSRPASGFVYYWVGVAVVASIVALSSGVFHFFSVTNPFQRRRSLHVLGQFLPCLLAGAAITLVIEQSLGRFIPLLPGLWAILFSLGVFATRPYLPHGIGWVALSYLLAGIVLLRFAENGLSLSPWGMGLTFGGGHLATAAVLYWSLERNGSDVE